MQAVDPVLKPYHVARKARRSRAGAAWRTFPAMMRDQWFDVDLLLDPFFLHLPVPTADQLEPADLVEAFLEFDQGDPWRNHYRDHPAGHPAHQLPRLANKFNPPATTPGMRPPTP
ncbi:hypothetical protein V7S43_015971 [Phytophthora oleae]|uniref:Uncharacterized protein n=1 Tax=Phytophthora oleae TaxID=2107226 RepID=A0ABD3EX21_9STRA